jgi:hypothetical protein
MEEQIVAYNEAGQAEAAVRLQEQLSLLNVNQILVLIQQYFNSLNLTCRGDFLKFAHNSTNSEHPETRTWTPDSLEL